MSEKKLCNEYEAAYITGMSPDLLRWLTSYAPKSGIQRKLKFVKKEGETYFFEQGELLDFNNWLKMPWPCKEGQKRPHIPTGIHREIKLEANGECAICQGHKDTCEAAHIDPVHKSFNNHPENLLWLCSNHHTSYDSGHFGPDEENAEFVLGFKRLLHRYKHLLWRTQHEISQKLLTVLEDCDGLAIQLQKATTSEQVKVVERIAKETLKHVPALAPVSKSDPKFKAFQSIKASAQSLSDDTSSISERLEKAHNLRQEFVAAYGFVTCPLCRGSGQHESSDCPVCNSDREIEKHIADEVDLSSYKKVNCPLCEGEGNFDGDVCPACGGDARMDKRYAERVDISDYQKVDCPLCNSTGRHYDQDCPVCGGDCELDRRHVVDFDLRQYKKVDCPLCEGEGQYGEKTCPECGGEKKMERRFAEQVDLRGYTKVNCPVCKGEGIWKGNDCPACGGDARIDRCELDRIDVRDYQMVECPVCKGQGTRKNGDDCTACDGDGKMERRHADRI